VTDAEWESLPEVGNLTGKKQKRNPRFDREYAMPDSVTLGHLASANTVGELTDAQMVRPLSSGLVREAD
jgi:pre-mRNA-processing factor 6